MIESFDVAVAPYIGMLAKIPMGSPLKVYTYLGCGRVVVTSDLPSLHIFKECSAVTFCYPGRPGGLCHSNYRGTPNDASRSVRNLAGRVANTYSTALPGISAPNERQIILYDGVKRRRT